MGSSRLRFAPTLVLVLGLSVAGCGGSSEPTVSFAGDTCEYSGPTEFEAGTLPAFMASNESDVRAMMVVMSLDAGLTVADVQAAMVGVTSVQELPDGIAARSNSGPMSPGDERTINVALGEPGAYLTGCMTMIDDTSARQMFVADQILNAS